MNDVIIFDLETKKEFAEVGGREHVAELGVSVLAAYSYQQNIYKVFEEEELPRFEEMLKNAGLVVGFNIRGFDIPVLQPYTSLDLSSLTILDMMDDVISGAGFRISLDNLAKTTLGIAKSADGLQALRWYREGKIQEIKDYCIQDVKVTRALYEYGKKNNYVRYFSRDTANERSIPVRWGMGEHGADILQTIKSAFEKRKTVEIDYITQEGRSESRNTRLVDVYNVAGNTVEGYCHLRKAKRIFKIDRIVKAALTEKNYQLSRDAQNTLF